MKTLAIFPDQVSIAGKQIYEDFARSTGLQLLSNSYSADAALIWSVLWHGRMKNNEGVYHHYRTQNKPVFILETGVIERNVTYKVCVNDTTVYGIYWNYDGDLDAHLRHHRMFNHIKPIKQGDKVLICAQNPYSLNWQKHKWKSHDAMEDWVRSEVLAAREMFGDRLIEIRPHPRHNLNLPDLEHLIVKHKVTVGDDTDLLDAFGRAHVVMNHNSYPGIQAILHGIPAITDSSSLATWAGVRMGGLGKLLDPHDDRYESFLRRLACTEFYHDEIESGFAWSKISHALSISAKS